MIETSQQPLTSRGKSKSEDTYRVFVESPACWGYVKSEKTKYQHMKAKYEQMKAKYQHVKGRNVKENLPEFLTEKLSNFCERQE